MVQQLVQNGLDVIRDTVGQDVLVLSLLSLVLNGVIQQNQLAKSLVQMIKIVADVGDVLVHVLFNQQTFFLAFFECIYKQIIFTGILLKNCTRFIFTIAID
jgi:hypothetical protein